ncbi:MAG: hypothetical protein SPL08_01185 [Pseudomonadota bacterium]|nr:hypothetical protein [Pseudomonadota bacterium]
MRIICWGTILGILCWATGVTADCPVADELARTKGLSAALSAYLGCAVNQNDDESQLYLAHVYMTGQENVAQNRQRALLFYHLSAENGNATAMVELARLLIELDNDDKTRGEITSYLEKIQGQFQNNFENSFKGELLHPYALLMLANEAPESKWFYLSRQKSDSRSAQLLKNYQIDAAKKKQVMRTATLWKQRKMVDMAREVFSVSEFNDFYRTLYPETGLPNAFTRAQAVEKLKSRIESR